jgi:prepilin-type N-terminal cleavage/methylation domain-containing protein
MTVRRTAERGLSLIEVLVATAVLAVAMIVALMLYDASRQAFAKSETATEQQESVRIAFDRLTTDLRMLGYNVNPDGNPTRPDQQLEGALDHAVIFRADFDRSDPAANTVPETALAGGAFSTVSTGNDEIVAYVLAKPDGTGPDTLTFSADVHEMPRDGTVEPVTIDNVVLTPTSPPYTLYRVTLNNDRSTYGTPGFAVRTPVIENVRDLSFVYYGANGTFKDPAASIPEDPAAKATRAGLTHVHVSLVGMTRQPDPSYVDPSDPVAPNFRKFELKGDVTPRNMRFKGIQDLNADVTPPSKPATPSLIHGHCGGFIVSWAANPPSDGVSQYRISWGPSASNVTGAKNVPGSPYFLDGLTLGATYYVTIQALDSAGNPSPTSDPASDTVQDSNTPSSPAGFTTTTDQTYHVAVSWTPVTTNTANAPPEDPQAPKIRDLAGYRLYEKSDNSVAAPADLYLDETVLSAAVPLPYLDTPLVACTDRYYLLTAVDTCGHESAPTVVKLGRVKNAGILPTPPADVQANFVSANTVQVKWAPITQDLAGNQIAIDHYEVYRSAPVADGAPWLPGDPGTVEFVVPTPSYLDNAVPHLGPGQVVYYSVNGEDHCGNESANSARAKPVCTFSGDVQFASPRDGSVFSRTPAVTVNVAGGSGSYTALTIKYVQGGTTKRTFTLGSPGPPPWTDNGWSGWPRGTYTITATVTNTGGCTQAETISVTSWGWH